MKFSLEGLSLYMELNHSNYWESNFKSPKKPQDYDQVKKNYKMEKYSDES